MIAPHRFGLTLLSVLLGSSLVVHAETAVVPAAPAAAPSAQNSDASSPAPAAVDPALQAELKKTNEELQRLKTEMELLKTRQLKQLLEGELEKQKLSAEIAIEKARQEAELAAGERAKTALAAQIDALKRERALERAKMEEEAAHVRAQLDLKAAKDQQALADLEAETRRLTADVARKNIQLKLLDAEQTQKTAEIRSEMTRMDQDIALRDKRENWAGAVNAPLEYLKNPFQDGQLVISDRRIPLNGPIVTGVADYVTRRIHYYNNQNPELPIFIVIDQCPGGSVMEGYRILKTMEASQAPIHVVVKSFAASMAAVITTLADQSYAYPNAIILHHQISGGLRGNLTQQKEQLEMMKEWARRLMEPVAAKMGIKMDDLIKKMYEHNSSGDWEEFADEAHKLKWVNHIVHEISESGEMKKPTDTPTQNRMLFLLGMEEQQDTEGRPFVRLPRVGPFDFYAIYDPQSYYR